MATIINIQPMRRTETTNPVSKKKNMKFKILNIDVQYYKPRNRTIGVVWLANDENIFIDSGLNQMTLRNTFDDIRELTPKEKKAIQEIIKDNLQIIEF